MDNSIFTGNKNKQVDYGEWSVHGHTLKVYDYHTAVEAIENIIEQGEGSSPCNPVAWDIGSARGLSHYFLFNSVVEEREIIVAAADENRDTLVIRFLIDSFVYSYTWTNFGPQLFLNFDWKVKNRQDFFSRERIPLTSLSVVGQKGGWRDGGGCFRFYTTTWEISATSLA